MIDFKNKKILITGASGGIGNELVKKFVSLGGEVMGSGTNTENRNWVVLFTTGKDPDWPDALDARNGKFIYFGDNKTPGRELHDTNKGGNNILRFTFEQLHLPDKSREKLLVKLAVFVIEFSPTFNSNKSTILFP